MSIFKIIQVKLFVLAALIFSSFSASAAIITDHNYFQFGNKTVKDFSVNDDQRTDFVRQKTRKLDGFDSSLGILTSVDIWFETDWDLQSRVWARDIDNDPGSDVVQGRAVARSVMTINLIDPRAYNPVRNVEREVARCSEVGLVRPTCTENSDSDGIFDAHYDLSNLMLSDFIDTELTLKITQKLTIEGFSNTDDDRVKAYNEFNDWSGLLFVQYEYDAFNVPEPSTIMLMLFGLFSLGFKRVQLTANKSA